MTSLAFHTWASCYLGPEITLRHLCRRVCELVTPDFSGTLQIGLQKKKKKEADDYWRIIHKSDIYTTQQGVFLTTGNGNMNSE